MTQAFLFAYFASFDTLAVGFFACAMLIPRPKLGKGIEALQYAYTERNISRYLSLKMVWPAALHYPAKADSPMLFTLIPHGFAPLGVTCYAVWSKVFGRRLTRWTLYGGFAVWPQAIRSPTSRPWPMPAARC